MRRRHFLSAVLVGAGLVAIPFRSPAARTLGASPEARALFGELKAGAHIERWTVVAVGGLRCGGIPVVLEGSDGRRFQIDVLRRSLEGHAIASTPSLALSLCNDGDGQRASEEEHGLATLALARALASREAAGAPVPSLLTLAERHARHPDGNFRLAV